MMTRVKPQKVKCSDVLTGIKIKKEGGEGSLLLDVGIL